MVKAFKIGKMTREELCITQIALRYYQRTLMLNGRLTSARAAEKLQDRFEKQIAKIDKKGSEKKIEM